MLLHLCAVVISSSALAPCGGRSDDGSRQPPRRVAQAQPAGHGGGANGAQGALDDAHQKAVDVEGQPSIEERQDDGSRQTGSLDGRFSHIAREGQDRHGSGETRSGIGGITHRSRLIPVVKGETFIIHHRHGTNYLACDLLFFTQMGEKY